MRSTSNGRKISLERRGFRSLRPGVCRVRAAGSFRVFHNDEPVEVRVAEDGVIEWQAAAGRSMCCVRHTLLVR